MPKDENAAAPTHDQVVQYIVDDRAMGCGWRRIATGLNGAGLRDADGARWSEKRVQRAHEAHPTKEPSFCRSGPPTHNSLTELMLSPDCMDHIRPLPDTVVERRKLWHWTKGTTP